MTLVNRNKFEYEKVARVQAMRKHSDGYLRDGELTINVENKYIPMKAMPRQIETILTMQLVKDVGGYDRLGVAHLTPDQLRTLIAALNKAYKQIFGYFPTVKDLRTWMEW